MATIVVEDGSGLSNANSYLSVADADAFHDCNYYSTSWPDDEESKKKALITATRMLDQQWQWKGYKTAQANALQWPRYYVPDPDSIRNGTIGQLTRQIYIPSDSVPSFIERATALFALVIVGSNREQDASGHGLESFELTGVMRVAFDLDTRQGITPDWLNSELRKYGYSVIGGDRTVKLQRV